MANITASNVLDGTTLNCELTLSFSNRTAAQVTVNFTAVAYLNASGHTYGGYESYSGEINVSGSGITEKTHSFTVKDKSTERIGSARHTVSGSFTLSLTGSGSLSPKITYRVRSSADSSNSVYGSCTLSVGAYTPPIPSNPDSFSVSASALYYGKSVTLNWGAVSGASGYKIYMSINDSAWVYITAVTGTSYSHTPNLSFGDNIRYKVSAYNSAGASSGKVSAYLETEGGLWLKAESVYKPADVYIKASGAWKRVKCVYIKVNGSWCRAI